MQLTEQQRIKRVILREIDNRYQSTQLLSRNDAINEVIEMLKKERDNPGSELVVRRDPWWSIILKPICDWNVFQRT
jgi:hypothetical protein